MWCHPMPKHEKKKYILLNNLGNKHTLVMAYWQVKSYFKWKIFSKNLQKLWPRNKVEDLFMFVNNLILIFEKADYIRYMIANISKYITQHTHFLILRGQPYSILPNEFSIVFCICCNWAVVYSNYDSKLRRCFLYSSHL